MQLDIATLSVIASIVSCSIFISLLVIARDGKYFPGFMDWTIGVIFYSFGFILLSLRNILSDFFSVILANTFILLHFLFRVRAVHRFSKTKQQWALDLIPIILNTILFLYFTYIEPEINYRVVIISIIFSYYSFRNAIIVWKRFPQVLPKAQFTLILTFLIEGFWSILRLVLTLTVEGKILDFMNASVIQATSFIINISALIISSILFLICNIKRLEFELETSKQEMKTLSGMLPICSVCKKIRKNDVEWEVLEQYISDHSEALFTHSICPDCLKNVYGMDDI